MIFSICLLGNLVAGWLALHGLCRLKSGDRYVSVKGIAERSVKADLAVWDIGYKIAGDNLSLMTKENLNNQEIIKGFLLEHNFVPEEIETQRIDVVDQYAREYGSTKPQYRYIMNGGVTLRTARIEIVQSVSRKSSELLRKGIVLMNKNDYLPNPRYFYTKLDEIRPQMLEQATKSARAAAEQFADNSGSGIGPIRRANQGVFQILGLDSNAGNSYGSDNDQIGNVDKIVRVVVSLDYLLR
jgi:hypothetical protein